MAAIAQQARERKMLFATVGGFYDGVPHRNGFVLDYGGLAHKQITQGVRALAGALRRVADPLAAEAGRQQRAAALRNIAAESRTPRP